MSVERYYKEEAGDGAFTSPPWIQELLENIISNIPYQSVSRALDLGSGCGANLKVLSKYFPSVVASDISVRILEESRQSLESAKYVVSDVEDLPFLAESFDVVVSTEVLEHIPNLEQAVRESWRVLRKGGYLIVSTPNYNNLLGIVKWCKDLVSKTRTWDPWGAHTGGLERFMTPTTVHRVLKKDFKILEKRGLDYFQSWLFFLKPLRRYYGRFLFMRMGKVPLMRSIGMHHFVLAEKKKW